MSFKLPTYSTFDRVGEFYTSLAAVIIGNLTFIGYRFFEVNTLFEKYLKDAHMDEAGVFIASKLISIVVIFTMLLISVNSNRFKYPRVVEGLGFVITLFINLYFWDIWNAKEWDEIIFKLGISLITASFDVAFAYLFVQKWSERNYAANMQVKVSDLERKASGLQQHISDYERSLKLLQAHIERRIKRIEQTTCPKCGRDDFSSKNAVNGHLRYCKGA